ncbi:MAG: hypothetical protein ACKVP3_00670, partial [Hyphomicrobiaceae bacterium]
AVISRRAPMLICPAIGDTDPIRYRRPTPDGQFSGTIFDEAMRPASKPSAAALRSAAPVVDALHAASDRGLPCTPIRGEWSTPIDSQPV